MSTATRLDIDGHGILAELEPLAVGMNVTLQTMARVRALASEARYQAVQLDAAAKDILRFTLSDDDRRLLLEIRFEQGAIDRAIEIADELERLERWRLWAERS